MINDEHKMAAVAVVGGSLLALGGAVLLLRRASEKPASISMVFTAKPQYSELQAARVTGFLLDDTDLKQKLGQYWPEGQWVRSPVHWLHRDADGRLVGSYVPPRRVGGLVFQEPGGTPLKVYISEAGAVELDSSPGHYELSGNDQEYLFGQVQDWLNENHEHVARQQRWYLEKPWVYVNGLTPAQAVAKLTELGW